MNRICWRATAAFFAATFAAFAAAQIRDANFPLEETWSLRDINDKPIPAGIKATLKIDGNLRGSGFAGCNSWSAKLKPLKDQHLQIGPIALTMMQCSDDIMAVESGFLSALAGSPTWDIVNGDLVIKGPNGSLRLARSP